MTRTLLAAPPRRGPSIDGNLVTMRALACLAVLYVHTGNDDALGGWGVALNQLLRFGAPALVFIAATLMFRGGRPRSTREFLRRRMPYLLAPYAVASALELTPYLAQGAWHKVPIYLLTGGGTHLFFIPLLLQLHGLFLLLVRHTERNWHRWFAPSLALSLAWSVGFLLAGVPVNRWQWTFPSWAVFFVMGAIAATDRGWFRSVVRRWRPLWLGGLAIATIGVAFQLLIGLNWDPVRLEILSTSRGPTIIVYDVLLLGAWIAAWKDETSAPWALGPVAGSSFGIYLLHPLVNAGLSTLAGFSQWPGALRAASVLGVTLALVLAIAQLPLGWAIVGKLGPGAPSWRRRRLEARATSSALLQ